MNIEGNEQQEYSQEYYTGAADFNVIAINPTYAQAKKLGLYVKEGEDHIDYLIKDKEDETKVIGCYVIAHLQYKDGDINIRARARYRVIMKQSYSEGTGKYQYVNRQGRNQWKESEDELTDAFVSAGNVRVALQGEGNLLEFLRCFFDIKGENSCEITMQDYRESLFKGDFSKFHKLVEGYPNNKVKFICGVGSYTTNDGEERNTQGIVDSLPLRTYAKLDDTYLAKNIEWYLNNTDEKYLLDIGNPPYDLEIWSPSEDLGGEPITADESDPLENTAGDGNTSGW